MPLTAFLVLCHHQPELLGVLVGRLQHPDANVFVHVDGRASSGLFKAAVEGVGIASFVPDSERRTVNWSSYSMIEAIYSLIRYALHAAPNAQRFVLLSGQDQPVYPVAHILARLTDGHEFIRVDRLLDPAGTGWFDHCGYDWYLGDRTVLNPRTAPWLLGRLVRRLERSLPRRKHYGAPIFYGPSWWALTRPAIDYVMFAYDREPWRLKWFRHARCPEEMVFQTLLRASPYACNIRQDATRPTGADWPDALAATTYAHFEPGASSPKILDLGDLPAIRASGALFARKFDAAHSRTLIEALPVATGCCGVPDL